MTTVAMVSDGARRWRVAGWLVAAVLLLLPFVAMQFTREVNWTASDFAIFGIMLFVPAAVFDALTRRVRGRAYRLATGLALGTAFALVWVNLAVGIVGSEDDPANLTFAAVLATLVGGAALARVRPLGMARALLATALAQVGVAAAVLAANLHGGDVIQARVLVAATVVFALLWLLSAALFWRAAAD